MCKLEILVVVSSLYTWIGKIKYEQEKVLSVSFIYEFWVNYKKSRHYITSHRKGFIHTKHIVFDGHNLKRWRIYFVDYYRWRGVRKDEGQSENRRFIGLFFR